MNRFDRSFGLGGEAKLRYLDGEFQIVSPGDHVVCAVTKKRIPLDALRYWSVEAQEAYINGDVSMKRYDELRNQGKAD